LHGGGASSEAVEPLANPVASSFAPRADRLIAAARSDALGPQAAPRLLQLPVEARSRQQPSQRAFCNGAPAPALLPTPQPYPAFNLGRLQLHRPLVVFDLETTGLSAQHDRIVEFSALKLQPDGSSCCLTTLLNPEQPIGWRATQVHHIHNADVADKPTFAQCLPLLRSFFADSDVAGHNVRTFDVPMLAAEVQRAAQPSIFAEPLAVVDTYRLFRSQVDKTKSGGNHRLATAYFYYCKQPLQGGHRAFADALACAHILLAQLQMHPQLGATVKALAEV
jgi:DNA polymerase-3 subunit epsilon